MLDLQSIWPVRLMETDHTEIDVVFYYDVDVIIIIIINFSIFFGHSFFAFFLAESFEMNIQLSQCVCRGYLELQAM